MSVNVEACVVTCEALEFIKRLGIPNKSLIQIGSSVLTQRKHQWHLETSNIQLLKSITHCSSHIEMHTQEMFSLLESCLKISDDRELIFTKDLCPKLFKAETISALFDTNFHKENDSNYIIITCKPYIDYPQMDYVEKKASNFGGRDEEQGRQRISKAVRKKMKKAGSIHASSYKMREATGAENVNSHDVIPTMLSENMNVIEAHLLIRIHRNDALFSSLKVSSSIDYCVSLYEALRTFMFASSNSI